MGDKKCSQYFRFSSAITSYLPGIVRDEKSRTTAGFSRQLIEDKNLKWSLKNEITKTARLQQQKAQSGSYHQSRARAHLASEVTLTVIEKRLPRWRVLNKNYHEDTNNSTTTVLCVCCVPFREAPNVPLYLITRQVTTTARVVPR